MSCSVISMMESPWPCSSSVSTCTSTCTPTPPTSTRATSSPVISSTFPPRSASRRTLPHHQQLHSSEQASTHILLNQHYSFVTHPSPFFESSSSVYSPTATAEIVPTNLAFSNVPLNHIGSFNNHDPQGALHSTARVAIREHGNSNNTNYKHHGRNIIHSASEVSGSLPRPYYHLPFNTANIATLKRSLTSPLSLNVEYAMTFIPEDATTPTPSSPPDLTGSKSSKSSSFRSSTHSDSDGISADISHFEEIGLDDDSRSDHEYMIHEPKYQPYTATYINELRSSVKRPPSRAHHSMQRELTSAKVKPTFPTLKGHTRQPTRDVIPGGLKPGALNPYLKRGLPSPTLPQTSMIQRHRSVSPNSMPLSPHSIPSTTSQRFRRGSWQSNRERKTAQQLENECDEDDGDDLSDDILLENVPISPRSIQERRSLPPSPDRGAGLPQKKEKVRPAGNGTPAIPVAQGSLRSPQSPGNKPPIGERAISMGQFPINHYQFGSRPPRAKSWTAALSDLNEEAKALTEALEAHADEQKTRPQPKRSASMAPMEKRRAQSTVADLPPLRKTDNMVDPLPISKEKEAVLSRTRPSWLPPKNPQEEKKHLKEYQQMMALSLEADKKREAVKLARESFKDNTASSLLRIWEEHVLPNWDAVIPMKRTRELWWRGISPRSRGQVWQKAVGNELGLTETSYHAALRRAKDLEKKVARGGGSNEEKHQGRWLQKIRKDVAATFPELKIFQEGGPLCDSLIDVAMAYTMYRLDVGYVSGLNTIVALLLLNLPSPASVFVTLCNILNRSLPTAFLTHDPVATTKYLNLAMLTLDAKLPRLFEHLNSPEHPTIALATQADLYLNDILTSLFTHSLDLESMTRLWDVWVFEGDGVLVRAAVALFACTESRLYACEDIQDVRAVLADLNLLNEGKGLEKDEERWMRAVRDAGRGTKTVARENSGAIPAGRVASIRDGSRSPLGLRA